MIDYKLFGQFRYLGLHSTGQWWSEWFCFTLVHGLSFYWKRSFLRRRRQGKVCIAIAPSFKFQICPHFRKFRRSNESPKCRKRVVEALPPFFFTFWASREVQKTSIDFHRVQMSAAETKCLVTFTGLFTGMTFIYPIPISMIPTALLSLENTSWNIGVDGNFFHGICWERNGRRSRRTSIIYLRNQWPRISIFNIII